MCQSTDLCTPDICRKSCAACGRNWRDLSAEWLASRSAARAVARAGLGNSAALPQGERGLAMAAQLRAGRGRSGDGAGGPTVAERVALFRRLQESTHQVGDRRGAAYSARNRSPHSGATSVGKVQRLIEMYNSQTLTAKLGHLQG